MTMIKRVARAIAEAQCGKGAPVEPEDRLMARAAIEAMRNPTDDMLHAGSQSIFHSDKDWQSNACWRAMIDAALSQAQPTGEKT